MLINSYNPEIILARCAPGQTLVNVYGRLACDIRPVFPYLNAILPGAEYSAASETLRFRLEGYTITLHAHEMAAAWVTSADEAVDFLTRVQQLVNETWAQRGAIEPSTIERKRPHLMAVYKLLPRTNCRACGHQTCLAFAGNLLAGNADLASCPPLQGEPRNELQAMIDAAPKGG